jgi:hypothetical protein
MSDVTDVTDIENRINFVNYHNYSDFKDIKLLENKPSGRVHCAKWKNTNVVLKTYNNQEPTLKELIIEVK